MERWRSWTTFLFGLWLVVAPYALGFQHQGAATGNDVIVGILIATASLWNAVADVPLVGVSIALLVFGGWVATAQLIFGYAGSSQAQTTNDLVFGLLIAAFSIAAIADRRPALGPEA